jgi:hypothetical protein
MAKKTRKKSPKRRKSIAARRTRKPKKATRRTNPARRYDPRLEFGLKYMHEGDSLAEAARKIGVMPAQLRSYAAATGIVTRKGSKWVFIPGGKSGLFLL